LERSCQEIRPEIGEELSGDKTGDWRGAVKKEDRRLERSSQEIRPEIGEELSGDKTGDWRGAVRR
jgi:hypothetical protein